MAALALVVLLGVALFHWLMEPWLQLLPALMELTGLLWLPLGLALWLLAGRSG